VRSPEAVKASLVGRILLVMGVTLSAIFAAHMILDNSEINKIVGPSATKTLASLCAGIVSILTVNYWTAIKGRNQTDWLTETTIAANFALLFGISLLPYLFAEATQERGWKDFLLGRPKTWNVVKADWAYGLYVLQLPLAWIAYQRTTSWLQKYNTEQDSDSK
jgi:hypothetical protein